MLIDTKFNVQSDARGGDPDSTSPTLKIYHKTLWSKELPSGKKFELTDKKSGAYLYHNSELGEFYLGSDAITHSYANQKKFKWITEQIPEQVQEVYDAGSTIGAYLLFPNRRIDHKFTINQARGINAYINDRFDLTLECIHRFYLGEESPLYGTFDRYKEFFELFDNFEGYIDFFLLNDLVNSQGQIKFYLPFDNFKTRPIFESIDEYLIYKDKTLKFISARNSRIEQFFNWEVIGKTILIQ